MDKKLFVAYKKEKGDIFFSSDMKDKIKYCRKEMLVEIIEMLMENNKILRKYIEILEKRNS